MDCLGRRMVLRGLAALPLACASAARARAGLPAVGYVSGGERGSAVDRIYRGGILKGLAEEGFSAPDKLRWLDRYAGNIPDRPTMVRTLEMLTRELVAEGAEAILCNGVSTVPAIAAAGPVPVVYGFSGDPISAGLADTLARPRGNATGVTLMFVETNAKRIEILKELKPSIRRLALLSSPNHPGEPGEIEVCRRAVATLGIDLAYMPVLNAADLEKALLRTQAEGADALMTLPDGVSIPNRDRLAAWALERRVPYVSGWAIQADSGALITYGPSVTWCFQRVGHYAARVLGGAKPADLPIEQPTRFELVINLKTARAIGIEVSPGMLGRADRLIE